MKRVFLYYPTIDFPDKTWLYQSLFYGDAVGTIVPFEGINDKSWDISDELKYLYDEGEYIPYFVNELIQNHPEKYSNHIKFYEKFVRSREYRNLQKNAEMIRLGLSHNQSLFHAGYVHLSTRLLSHVDGTIEIENEGQVRPHDDKLKIDFSEPIDVRDKTNFISQLTKKHKVKAIYLEQTAGLYYMFTLAQFISEADTNLVSPSTNDPLFEKLAFSTSATTSPGIRILLDKCLPTPSTDIPIKSIIRFKRKRKNELLQLRQKLQELQVNVNKADSRDEVKEVVIGFSEQVTLELSTIKRLLLEDRINFAFESMSSLLSLGNPAILSSLLAGGVIATQINPALGVGLGGVGVIGEIITRHISKRKSDESNVLSYLFSAKKEGLIKWS